MEAGAPASRASVWQIAHLPGGPCRPPQDERVIPMTVLRRCVLAHTKAKVLAAHKRPRRQAEGRLAAPAAPADAV